MHFEYVNNQKIKNQLINLKKEHKNFDEVFRLIRGAKIVSKEFLPSIIDPNQKNCKDEERLENYSCSLCNKDLVVSRIQLPYYKEQFSLVAIGATSELRGVSPKPNKNGHISYFLYDYIDNNPYKDFNAWKEIKNDKDN